MDQTYRFVPQKSTPNRTFNDPLPGRFFAKLDKDGVNKGKGANRNLKNYGQVPGAARKLA